MRKITYDKDIRAQKIYRALVKAAKAGKPCPRNDELSTAAGSKAMDAASSILTRLRDKYGKIRIERRGHVDRRVFIVGTDLGTDWSLPPKCIGSKPEVMPSIIGEKALKGVTFSDEPRAYAAHRGGRAPSPEVVGVRSSAAPDQWSTGFNTMRSKRAA